MNERLRYFLEVADEGSMSRAAKNLYLTTQSLSEHINKLESEVGVRLFVRNSKGVRLTPAGKVFQQGARRIVEETDELIEECVRKATLDNVLVVGQMPLAPQQPSILALMAQRCPEAQVDLVDFTASNATLDRVAAGDIDAVTWIDGPYVRECGLEFSLIRVRPLECLVSPLSPLAEQDSICVTDLLAHPVASPNKDWLHVLGSDVLAALDGHVIDTSHHSFRGIRQFCMSDMGIYLLSGPDAFLFSGLVRLPLDPPATWDYGIVHRQDVTRALERYIECSREVFAQTG